MTQDTNAYTVQRSLRQRLLLVQGIGWIGSLGILGSGIALAQAPKDLVIPEPNAVPSQTTPMVPAAEILAVPQSTSATAPTASEPAPTIHLESRAPNPAVHQAPSAVGTDSNNDRPSEVVFSERSTGCKSVAKYGQGVTESPCEVTRREAIAQRGLAGSPADSVVAVSMGPISVSSSGLGFSTTTATQDYYNQTVRPPSRLGNGNISLIFPLSIPAIISSTFGWRVHPITGDRRLHSGTDLAAPLGTPVLAAYAGQVAIADFLGGYGLTVALSHNKATQETLYGHLSEIFVKPGEWVKQGEVIGRVGSTGYSTGPHLHFEFRQQTPDGWVAMDAGAQLEYAMAQLVKSFQTAQATPNKKG